MIYADLPTNFEDYLERVDELCQVIQPGDVCEWQTDAASGVGVAHGHPRRSCLHIYIVSLFDGEYYMPHDVTTIVRIERGGLQCWPPEMIQLRIAL